MLKDLTYTLTKSTVECYKLRDKTSGMYWADITIDAKETTGRIQIASDFGSWQNYWGACGCSFKEFLTKLDMEYFAGKVGESHWFDFDKTILQYKGYVLHERRNDLIESCEARKMFDEIKSLDEGGRDGFTQIMYNDCPTLMRQFDYCPDTHTSVSPQFRKFWETAWKAFVIELKAELAVNPNTVGV